MAHVICAGLSGRHVTKREEVSIAASDTDYAAATVTRLRLLLVALMGRNGAFLRRRSAEEAIEKATIVGRGSASGADLRNSCLKLPPACIEFCAITACLGLKLRVVGFHAADALSDTRTLRRRRPGKDCKRTAFASERTIIIDELAQFAALLVGETGCRAGALSFESDQLCSIALAFRRLLCMDGKVGN